MNFPGRHAVKTLAGETLLGVTGISFSYATVAEFLWAAQRDARAGDRFFDTTLGYERVFDNTLAWVPLSTFTEFYQITFVGAAAAGYITPTIRTNGAALAVGDKIVLLTGYVTATGAAIAMPTIGATNFAALLVLDTTAKVQQIQNADLSANTYEALMVKVRT